MVVLKEFQKNLFHISRSLARILSLWVEKIVFSLSLRLFLLKWQIKQSINWLVGIVLITSNRRLHLFDNFWMFKTQNTDYNYIYAENYVYKKLKKTVEICKNQTKKHSVLAKIFKVYIICIPKCDAIGKSFFPLLNIMECYKPNRWRLFYFLYAPLHSTRIVFASFGNLYAFFI